MTRGIDLTNPVFNSEGAITYNPEFLRGQYGLTKREYFAAMAMQGLCANSIPGRHHQHDFLATEAVAIADTLIDALNKTSQP